MPTSSGQTGRNNLSTLLLSRPIRFRSAASTQAHGSERPSFVFPNSQEFLRLGTFMRGNTTPIQPIALAQQLLNARRVTLKIERNSRGGRTTIRLIGHFSIGAHRGIGKAAPG